MTTWTADTQLASYEAAHIPLPEAETFAGEHPGTLCATLVRRNPPARRRAMLYVHGWSDYFFQAHLADEMTALGYDFYAIDLRRYGRSLRSGQLAGFITDLTDYYVELDEAARIIREEEGHDQLVLMGHSTGGLITTLWADARPGQFAAVVENSPWLDLQGTGVLRAAVRASVGTLGSLAPTAVIPLADNGFYHRSISATEAGEWHYNTNLKADRAFLVRAGWLSAVVSGHAAVAKGLAIDAPVLVCLSNRTRFARTWSDELFTADTILDVARLAARVPGLCSHTTLIRIADGMHDLALSREPVRRVFFDEVARWLAYANPVA